MRNIFLVAAVAVLSFTTVQAQNISFGAKAGANFASLNGDDADGLDGRTSFQVGGVVNIGISELFAVQPEVVYSAQGYTQDTAFGEVTGKLDYINIPVLADFTLAEGFSLQGGPQVGINITDEADLDGETASIGAESVDFSAAIGAQYRTPLGLFFQARYSIGLSNVIGDMTIEGVTFETDAKNSVVSVAAGWFF